MDQVTRKHKESNDTYTKEIATLQPTEQQLKVQLMHIALSFMLWWNCMYRAFMDRR